MDTAAGGVRPTPAVGSEDIDWERLYGPWRALDPAGVKTLLDGFPRPWWLIGGYALEAFTGPLEHSSRIWIREHASAPWIADVPMTPDVDGRWQSKRDPSHVADLDEVTWVSADGIRYLNPEIVLLFKAKDHRPKDERDPEVAWPMLSRPRQAWLRESVRRLYGDHPWNPKLDSGP